MIPIGSIIKRFISPLLGFPSRKLVALGTAGIRYSRKFRFGLSPFKSETRITLRQNRILQQRIGAKRCFLLGTGPSLGDIDLSLLENEITIVCNSFVRSGKLKTLKPALYVVIDPLFFTDSKSTNDFWQSMASEYPDGLILVPILYRSYPIQFGLAQENILAFHNVAPLEEGGLQYSNLEKSCPSFLNVMQACISAALYGGSKKIYLLGADHNWLTHRGESQHFHHKPSLIGKDAPPTRLDAQPYDTWAQMIDKLWKGYRELKRVGENHRAEIYNTSTQSMLDVFPKVSLEAVLKEPTSGGSNSL